VSKYVCPGWSYLTHMEGQAQMCIEVKKILNTSQVFRNAGFVKLAVICILSIILRRNRLKCTNNLPRRGHQVTAHTEHNYIILEVLLLHFLKVWI
jgi:hypothetical protein